MKSLSPFLLVFCLFLSSPGLFAQSNTQHLHFEEVSLEHPFPELQKEFKTYTLYTLDTRQLANILNDPETQIQLKLHLGQQQIYPLSLIENNYRRQSLKIQLASEDKLQSTNDLLYKTFRGDAKVSITADRFYAHLPKADHTLYIEPLRLLIPAAGEEYFIAYTDLDLIDNEDVFCRHGHMEQAPALPTTDPQEIASERMTNSDCRVAEIAIAADYLMFLDHGSRANVIAYLDMLLEEVSDIYLDHFDFGFEVATYYISDCESCDHWGDSTLAFERLRDFRFWGQGGGFMADHDIATLWTLKGFEGGVQGEAYRGQACLANRYSVCYRGTGIARNITLWAHELGHLFNALDDGPFSQFIMKPSLNSSTEFSPVSIAAISTRINTNLLMNCLACTNDLAHENTRRILIRAPYGYWGVYTEVVNQGAGAIDSTQTSVYISFDTQLDASDILVGSQSTPALDIGERDTLSGIFYFLPPNGTKSLYALIKADDSEDVAEADEDNNLAVIPLIFSNTEGSEQTNAAENDLTNTLMLYPNPVEDVLHIAIPEQILGTPSIEVLDVNGRLLMYREAKQFDTTVEVDVSDWPGGVYFVQLNTAEGTQHTQRFIKR